MNKNNVLLLAFAALLLAIPAFGDAQVLTYGPGGANLFTFTGTGGCTVTQSGNTVTIDGSTVVGTNPGSGFTASNKSSSFSAAVNNCYFVSATSTVTLPTAVGVAGKQIQVVNTGGSATLTINTTSAQTVNGASSGTKTDATQYDTLVFTSDGANWFASKKAGL